MNSYDKGSTQYILALTRLIFAGFLVVCFTASDGYAPTAVEYNVEKNPKGGVAGSGKSGRSHWRKAISEKFAGKSTNSKFSQNPALNQDLKNINRRAQNATVNSAVATQSLPTNPGRSGNAFEAGGLTTTTGKKIPEMLPDGGNTRDMRSGLSGTGLLPGVSPADQTSPLSGVIGQGGDPALRTTIPAEFSPARGGNSGRFDSSGGLMDSTREQTRQRRGEGMSTDPRSHNPDDKIRGELSPRANRTEQTSSTPLVVGDDSSGGSGGTGTEDTTSDTKTEGSDPQEPADQSSGDADSGAKEQDSQDKESSSSDPDNSRDQPADPRHDEERKEEDYTVDDTMAPEINPLPDDVGGPLPSGAVPIVKALEKMEDRARGTRITPADKSPWINPGPDGSSDQGDLGSRRPDPITPLINPNPEDQGSGGGGDQDRRVNDPNYGQVDPSPDSEDDPPASGNDPN